MNLLLRLATAAVAATLGAGLAAAAMAAPAAAGVDASLSDPILCGVDDISVPESSATGVVTDWLSYGESLTVTPYADQIWAGVWFTGWNGPAGWPGTAAPSSYPAPGVREYSLVGRVGNGSYQYIGAAPRTFTNNKPGVLQRVRFRVNDNTPGNGSGAFRVFVEYPCH